MLSTTWAEQDLKRHEEQAEKWLASRPVCDACNEPIQEEYMYEYENEYFCPTCWEMFVNSNFLKYIE